MSKKGNIYSRNKKTLKNNDGFLPRAEYSAETAKNYILAVILIFHILPLVLKLCGATGAAFLNVNMRVYVNPMAVLAVLLIYGIKLGFNFKMPMVATLLCAVSTIMYYQIDVDLKQGLLFYYFQNFGFFFVLYAIMAFVGILAGSFIKKLKIF